MAGSTAPILLTGGTTMLSDYLQGMGVKWNVALATGIAAGIFALLEKADPPLVVGLAWLAFVGSMVTPRGTAKPPIEVFLTQWNKVQG
jgi:hypothetical protein